MTNEEKQILLKDLCMRLPYGLIAQYHGTGGFIKGYEEATIDIIVDAVDISKHTINYHPYEKGYASCLSVLGARMFYDRKQMVFIKPYLRPMFSMTDEEFGFLYEQLPYDITRIYSGKFDLIDDIHLGSSISIDDMAFLLDCLNKWHFDYRGLIEKGLALEAPEGMYNFK